MTAPFDGQPVWSTACPDWERRIVASESLVPFAPLFPGEAAAAMDVFNGLRVVDAPGSPMMADAARPWVKDFVASIFGAYDPDSGRRLVNEFFLLISKKNTKSTTAAGIMLTALILNWRESAEFIILAPTIEIAKNSFDPVRDMIRKDPELSDLLLVQEHTRTVTHRLTNATLKVVAADNDTVGGKKAVGILVDELWIFGKRDGAENMLREATGGLASRPEGFVIYLTTQSDEPPRGVFRTKLLYARGVRDGRITDRKFLPVIYEFPDALLKEEKHKDPAYFYITNPNLGTSVDVEFLEREYAKALQDGEDSVRGFLAKHLNVEIGMALRSDRWAGADYWLRAQNVDRALTLRRMLERCDVVTCGADGGGADDLFGFGAIGREKITRRWLAWCKAWAHPVALERRKINATWYEGFVKDEDLQVITDYPEDIDGVVELVELVKKAQLFAGIGLDVIGIGALVDALDVIDVTQENGLIEGISQGYKLSGTIKTVERKVIDGSFVHAGQPLLNWSVSNAKVEPTRNAFLITKQASGKAKIDPLMAMLNAAVLMERNPQAKRSVYEDRGLRKF
ncbi:phage terminase large subunit-like protein [Azospirillum agricola]|uniref:terminase large subunit n=1 Tax=Azospirillum agricola TaxID=1720247 RepID=UPI001AE0EF7B|nr:terminase large subunit [Azospirillum agricola]MBP2233094.1 phage terminase large subunit-like protein [Azospirillum agricola]